MRLQRNTINVPRESPTKSVTVVALERWCPTNLFMDIVLAVYYGFIIKASDPIISKWYRRKNLTRDLLLRRGAARHVLSLRGHSFCASKLYVRSYTLADVKIESPRYRLIYLPSTVLPAALPLLPHNHPPRSYLFLSAIRKNFSLSPQLLVSFSDRALFAGGAEWRACKAPGKPVCLTLRTECSSKDPRIEVSVTMKRDFISRGSSRWSHSFPKIVDDIFYGTHTRNF